MSEDSAAMVVSMPQVAESPVEVSWRSPIGVLVNVVTISRHVEFVFGVLDWDGDLAAASPKFPAESGEQRRVDPWPSPR